MTALPFVREFNHVAAPLLARQEELQAAQYRVARATSATEQQNAFVALGQLCAALEPATWAVKALLQGLTPRQQGVIARTRNGRLAANMVKRIAGRMPQIRPDVH